MPTDEIYSECTSIQGSTIVVDENDSPTSSASLELIEGEEESPYVIFSSFSQ